MVEAYTCRSLVLFSPFTGEFLKEDIAPEEQAMFDRFISAIEIRE